MKAIVIQQRGGPENLVIKDVPEPEPKAGEVVIQIKAFGLNHAEKYMRKGLWGDTNEITGIECVGIVKSCPGGEFQEGSAVAAILGGIGVTVPGSYAEYTRANVASVVSLGSLAETLGWDKVAAIPESYTTAWMCLFGNLKLTAGQRLLVRGGTAAFGQAAINLAVQAGARVVATSRNKARFPALKALGAEDALLEGPELLDQVLNSKEGKFDAILELIGNTTILDSIKMTRRDGRVCMAGFLGGLDPIPNFDPFQQMASGVHFSFFLGLVFGSPEYPLSEVPLADIVKMVVDGKFKADPFKVFKFGEIQEAHQMIEDSTAVGKLVVVVE